MSFKPFNNSFEIKNNTKENNSTVSNKDIVEQENNVLKDNKIPDEIKENNQKKGENIKENNEETIENNEKSEISEDNNQISNDLLKEKDLQIAKLIQEKEELENKLNEALNKTQQELDKEIEEQIREKIINEIKAQHQKAYQSLSKDENDKNILVYSFDNLMVDFMETHRKLADKNKDIFDRIDKFNLDESQKGLLTDVINYSNNLLDQANKLVNIFIKPPTDNDRLILSHTLNFEEKIKYLIEFNKEFENFKNFDVKKSIEHIKEIEIKFENLAVRKLERINLEYIKEYIKYFKNADYIKEIQDIVKLLELANKKAKRLLSLYSLMPFIFVAIATILSLAFFKYEINKNLKEFQKTESYINGLKDIKVITKDKDKFLVIKKSNLIKEGDDVIVKLK